jgi:hypothetical protein
MGFYRDAGEIRVVNLQSGRTEAFAPGVRALKYDISPDGGEVVIEVPDEKGKSRLFLAPLDRSAPPSQIPNLKGERAKIRRKRGHSVPPCRGLAIGAHRRHCFPCAPRR